MITTNETVHCVQNATILQVIFGDRHMFYEQSFYVLIKCIGEAFELDQSSDFKLSEISVHLAHVPAYKPVKIGKRISIPKREKVTSNYQRSVGGRK